MSENNKIRRFPRRISGRAFSNGILFRGGDKKVLAVRTKSGNIDIETAKIVSKKSGNSFTAFLNMIVMAFSGLIESVKAFKKNKSFSVKRLFKYHGAEHKIIHCYENGMELNIENAKRCTTYHPRCGSVLAANVLILEGLICLIVPAKVRNALWGFVDVALFLAAFFAGFKLARYSADNNNKLSRALSVPGRLLQKVTALEPDEDMLECGIEAAKKLVQSE